MSRRLSTTLATLWLTAQTASALAAPVDLFEWGFNVNGTVHESAAQAPEDLPATFDTSQFNFGTRLGTIALTFTPGVSGDYQISAFFDHELTVLSNTSFNEFGATSGTPGAGQSWEIDEPGYTSGTAYHNFLAGTLDNTNGVPDGANDDVSMALGWAFHLQQGGAVRLRFTLGTTAPTGFALAHTDPESHLTVYLSSQLDNLEPVPEPGTLLLMGSGLLGLVGLGYNRRKHHA
jgi:hypothetical protein